MATTLDSKGNEIINGFSTNMTPAQNAISTQSLQGATPLRIQSPADITGIYNQASQLATGITQQAVDTAQAEQQAIEARNNQMAQSNSVADLTRMAGGKLQERANLSQTNGENELLKQLSQLNVESQGLQRSASAIPLQLQENSANRGITLGGIAPIESGLLRQNTLKQLDLAQRAAIAQGNYDVAKNLADQQIEAKYAQIDAEIAARKINEEAMYKNVTDPAIKRADSAKNELLKRQLEERMAQTKREEEAKDEKKASDLAVSNMLIEASPVAPPDVMARAKAVQAKGGSAMEVATALGKYGGDYLAREKIKAEIAKMDADAIKTRADAAKTRGETTGGGTGTTGTASDNAKAWLAQYNSGTMSLEDIYTKIGSSKEASVLKNEVARLIAAQGGKRVFGLDDASIQAINAQIKNVDDLLYGNGKKEIDKTTGDVGSIVGFVQGGLGVIPDAWNTGKQDALAVAKNLVSNQTLQALADAKAKGITFGALSEGELGLVADAASRISAKLKIDPKTKEIIGFTGSESQFKDDLKTIRDNLAKSIETKTQSKQSNMSKEESTADDIMTANKKIRSEINSGYNVFDN